MTSPQSTTTAPGAASATIPAIRCCCVCGFDLSDHNPEDADRPDCHRICTNLDPFAVYGRPFVGPRRAVQS